MEDHAERIVEEALALGAQDAVADVVVDRDYQLRFAQNEPVIANEWRKTTANVFLVYDQRVVAGSVTDLAKAPEAVARLVKMAKASRQNPDYVGLAKGPARYRRLAVDRRVTSLSEGSDFVEAAIHGALAEGAKECAGSFWRVNQEHFLHTSAGVAARDHRAHLYLSIRALAAPESSGHGVTCATRVSQFRPERAGRKAGHIAALAKDPAPGKAGTYDVVFDHLILGSLICQVGVRSSAYLVSAGLSPFLKRLGKRVASEIVTILDDGTADTIGRQRFDDEGVPTRRKAIVQRGVLKTYLHNTSTAKKSKTRTTANAGLLVPAPHALVLQPGDWTEDELIEEVRDGLWLTNTWYTRYQSYVAGDLSTIPRDGIFRIRKGEIVGAWKDVRLTDNLLGIWKRVKGISKKAEQVEWWGEISRPAMAPSALATKVGITKSAM